MRMLVGAALTLLAIAAPSAQTPFPDPYLFPNPPWCPTCFIAANIDTPQSKTPALAHMKAARLAYGDWYIAGWAFVCNGGALPTKYEVAYRTDDGSVVTVRDVVLYRNLYRPDVQTAFHRGCPGTPNDAGFHLYFTQTHVPPGTRDLYVRLWQNGVLHVRHLVVTID